MAISQKDLEKYGGVWIGVEMPRITTPDEPHLFDLPLAPSPPALGPRTAPHVFAARGLWNGVRRSMAPRTVTHAPPITTHSTPAWVLPPDSPKTMVVSPRAAPSAPRAAPSAPRAAPSAPRAAPSAPRDAPSAPHAAPSAPRAAPSAPRDAPSAPHAAPSAPCAAPSAPHAAPSAPCAAPSAPHAAPSAPRAAPCAPRAAPCAPRDAPSVPCDAPSAHSAVASAPRPPSVALYAPPVAPLLRSASPPATSGFETQSTDKRTRRSHKLRRALMEEPHLVCQNHSTKPNSTPPAPLVDLSIVPTPRSVPVGYEAPRNIQHFQFPVYNPVGEHDKQNVARQRKTMVKHVKNYEELTATSFEGKSNMDGSSSGKKTKIWYDRKKLKSPTQLMTPHAHPRRSSASIESIPVQLATSRPPPASRRSIACEPRQLGRHQRYERLQTEGYEQNGMVSSRNELADPRMESTLARRNEPRPLLSRPKWEYKCKLPPIGRGEESSSVDIVGESASRYKNAPVKNETATELEFSRKTSEQKDTPNWLRSNKLPPISSGHSRHT